ncbi:hypothetical protein JCM10296v2_006856 [Rhodotorula toruloides]
MPPRRSTRSTAKPARSSPSPSFSSDLEVDTAPSSRKGKGKGGSGAVSGGEGGLEADDDLAWKLQDEEDQAALVAGEEGAADRMGTISPIGRAHAKRNLDERGGRVSQGPSASASTSSARRKSPRKPSTSSSALLDPSSSFSSCAQPSSDSSDPQVVLGPKKALFVGGGTCGACKAEVPYKSEILLSALDTVYLTDHLRRPLPPASTSSAPSKRRKTAAATGKGKGVGYASNRVVPSYAGVGGMGVGYAAQDDDEGWDSEDDELWDEEMGEYVVRERVKPTPTTQNPRENAHDLAQDRLYLLALRFLSSLLPSPDSPTPKIYDFLPSPLLSSLIELSTLPDLLTLLLRNDSVPEWQRRSEVYFAMLDVLGKIGGSEGLLGVLFGERREKRWSEGIEAWMRGVGEVKWERKVAPGQEEVGKGKKGKGKAAPRGRKRRADEGEEGENKGEVVMTAPLYTHLGKLLRQASAFRKAAISGDFDDSDAALIGICGDFVTAGERFKQTKKVWGDMHGRNHGGAVDGRRVEGKGQGKGKGKGKEREWTEADYVKACEALAYDSVNLAIENDKGEVTYPTHYYNRDILTSANSRRTNFAHLAKELAVLSTSLPPGIWVRVDETRVDVIKCLIAGPEHSPYANGLFEFDIFLPLQYPLVSPVCWLKTTGGNKVRFNPNLYAEGKVCLSLLGTWSGAPEEMWQPGQSTILQVLLSISSMILGTNYPFYNEPGMGATKDDERNKNYNKNCSLATTRWAILDWIKDGKFKESIWSDIIVSHFRLQRSKIVSTIEAWAAKDPRMRAWKPGFDSCAGATHLQPYNGGMAYKWAQYNANGQKQSEQNKPAPPPESAPRDLVQETEDALESLAGWKESGWLEKLVA